jgi:hypothetical protein
MMNIVDPYISITSPGRRTPALSASNHASMEPVTTDVPGRRPVSAAARARISPTVSPGQTNRGSGTGADSMLAQSSAHSCRLRSYIGSH